MKVVIVTGISGIGKSGFINNFIKHAKIGDVSEVIKFEDVLVDRERDRSSVHTPSTVPAFLDIHNQADKVKTLNETFEWIRKIVFDPAKKYIFLDMHLTYYKNSEYFPPFDQSRYIDCIRGICSKSGAADDAETDDIEIVVINLIDDAFNIWKLIADKAVSKYPDTKLTLREVLSWRSLESLQTESLTIALESEYQSVPSYMVSVRHPPSTFRNLIVPKVPLCFYLSYPISNTRNNNDMIDEINDFRRKMHEMGEENGVAVFDPVTIDELYQGSGDDDAVRMGDGVRWPLGVESLSQDGLQHVEISNKEIGESKKQIEHQIRSRDYKLVGSSKVLAVFKPCFGGPSKGVRKEIEYALSKGITVVVYTPLEKGQPDNQNPFDDNVETISDLCEYYKRLEVLMKDLKR